MSLQPTERSIRYTNLRSAMAEEGVIRLLLHDDTIFPQDAPLQEEDFSSPLLGKIFGLLWQHRSSAYPMAALGASLSGEEMSHLTALIQKPESTANAEKSLQDYLRIIQEEKMKRADSGVDPLVLAMEIKRNSQK